MFDRKFLSAIIFFCGVILLVGWFKFIYEPMQSEILNMELETRRLRKVEREILELKARHEDLAEFVADKEAQLDAARIFLPATLAQDKFIDELYRTAEVQSVRIISIRAGEADSSENLQSQGVSVKLEADYISILNFIRAILDGERLTRLEKISISSDGGILSCELSLKIFAAVYKNPSQ